MKLFEILKRLLKNDIFLITFFYSLAYGIFLFNDGVFLDDWVFYHVDNSTIMSFIKEIGMPWLGWYNIFMLTFNSMIAYRILVFVCYLFSAFFLYGVLKTIKEIRAQERLPITLFFALFPVNFARFALMTSQYAVCYFLFFLSLLLLSRYFLKRNIFFRAFALVLLFLSFSSAFSLLIFYGLVIFYVAYSERVNIKNINSLSYLSLRYSDFLIVPCVFWIIRNIFFMPYGDYGGRNQLTVGKFLSGFYNLPAAFSDSFIAPLQEAFHFLSYNSFMTIIPALLIGALAYKKYSIVREEEDVNDLSLLLFGLFAFLLGVYPYLVTGKMPVLADWNSRYQMLTPLGASFIVFYLVRIIFKDKYSVFVYSLLLVLFVHANFSGYLKYQQDWFKQLSLIENFRESEILKNNTSFLFNDKAVSLNARGRRYHFYECTGLMKYSFGNERRFGTTNWDGDAAFVSFVITRGQYNCREFKVQKPQYEVVIDYGTYGLSDINTIKLMALRFTNPDKFKKRIKNLIKLEYLKL